MRYVFVLALAMSLVGCATKYQPNGLSGGFKEVQLDDNVYQVSFRGNGFTRMEDAEEMTLLRSSELMLAKGFPFFVLINSASRTDYQAIANPGTAYTNGTVNQQTGQYRATTTMVGGGVTMIASPSSTNTVVGLKERPANGMPAYNTQMIYDSLAQKYKASQ